MNIKVCKNCSSPIANQASQCAPCYHKSRTGVPRYRLSERLLKHIKKVDGCWLWTASKDNRGYGMIKMHRNGKESGQHASRISYECFRGEIPAGLIVCHKCKNKSCINPEHLYAGTYSQNTQDAIRDGFKPFINNDLRGEKHPLSKLKKCDVKCIRENYIPYKNSKELSKRFSVTISHISEVAKKRCWKHL